MNLANLFKIALRAIWSNKFRSFLSMLGIIIGVAAVIIMMSIGQGSKESVRANISKMGTNLITVRPGSEMRGGVRRDPSEMQTLKIDDYEKINAQKSYISKVSPEVNSSGQAVNGAKNTTSSMYGESTDYLDIKQWVVQDGECFTDEDVKHSAKVCLIGKTVVTELFGENVDPIGKTIRFKSIPFRVIGVLKSKGYNSWGMDQDNIIIAPYTTVMKRVLAQTYLNNINCSALTEEMTQNAIDELTQILRTNHKIPAGIGIMNIMLVSVTERTKEIGLRMSVGATGMDISNQFLLESILISITGGVLGLIVGFLGTKICAAFNLPTSIPLWSILVSFAVCTLIGIIFGYFPAKKAADLDPIEAIRYE